MWLLVDQRAGPGKLEAQNVLPTVPMGRVISRTRSWETKVLRRPSELWTLDCDWTWLKLLHKLLRLWQAGAEIYSFCCCLRQTLYVSSFAYVTCHPPICSGLTLPLASLYPPFIRASLKFHPENSRGCGPTTMPEKMVSWQLCWTPGTQGETSTNSHLWEARRQACKPLLSMKWDKWHWGFSKDRASTEDDNSNQQGSAHCLWLPYPQCLDFVLPASVSLFLA